VCVCYIRPGGGRYRQRTRGSGGGHGGDGGARGGGCGGGGGDVQHHGDNGGVGGGGSVHDGGQWGPHHQTWQIIGCAPPHQQWHSCGPSGPPSYTDLNNGRVFAVTGLQLVELTSLCMCARWLR
jgi:hypothetical protein